MSRRSQSRDALVQIPEISISGPPKESDGGAPNREQVSKHGRPRPALVHASSEGSLHKGPKSGKEAKSPTTQDGRAAMPPTNFEVELTTSEDRVFSFEGGAKSDV
jgi:hypothetical protein